jgi:hypothetical protein
MTGRYTVGRWFGQPAVLDQSHLPSAVVSVHSSERDAEDLASLMNQQQQSAPGCDPDALSASPQQTYEREG